MGALVNSVFLVALCFSITVESIKRFLEPEEIKDPKLILIVGGVGLGINLVSSVIWLEKIEIHPGSISNIWSNCRLECFCLEMLVMGTAMEDQTRPKKKVMRK